MHIRATPGAFVRIVGDALTAVAARQDIVGRFVPLLECIRQIPQHHGEFPNHLDKGGAEEANDITYAPASLRIDPYNGDSIEQNCFDADSLTFFENLGQRLPEFVVSKKPPQEMLVSTFKSIIRDKLFIFRK